MKLPAALLAAPFALATTHAQQVIIYQPQTPVTVVSPLTTATAQSNQTLLNQITGTVAQRRIEHQTLTLQSATALNNISVATPIVIRK